MDVYIYTLNLTEENPKIEISVGEAVKLFELGKYTEYDVFEYVAYGEKELLMSSLSSYEMNIPFFSSNKKTIFLVATDDSNELDDVQKIFRFCYDECNKLIARANQMNSGMEAANNYLKEALNGETEQD